MSNTDGYYIDSTVSEYGPCLVLTGPWHDHFAQLMLSQGISVLRLSSSAGWKDEGIEFVADLDFLVGLEVYSWGVKDVSPVFRNRGLRLIGLQCEFNSVVDFSSLDKLEVCKIFWRSKVIGIDQCSNLLHLNVIDYPYSDLTYFSSLSKLKRLQIESKKLLSLKGMQSMSRLKSFDAFNCIRLNDIVEMNKCEDLESVTFESCKKISMIPDKFDLSKLQVFSLIDCGKIESLIPLSNCKSLKSLKFVGDTIIQDGALDFLLNAPAVDYVWFANRKHYSMSREALMEQLQSVTSNRKQIHL